MTITEFLTARLDEDEAIWKQAAEHGLLLSLPGGSPVLAAHGTVERFLVDVAAKRAIVALYQAAVRAGNDSQVWLLDEVLNIQVQPYAEHPDFDEEWRH